jgi:DNA-binding CsgD family transcriptional regulator
MLSERHLSRLILAAYDAAATPEKWPAFLKQFAETAKGSHAAILLNDYSRQHYNVSCSYNVDPDAQQKYQSHFAVKDAYYLAGQAKLCTGWCGTSQMLLSDQQLFESEFYQDYQRKYDMFHNCVAVMRSDSNAISALTLLRSRHRGPFGNDHIKLLNALLPHLQKSLDLHRRMIELRLSNEKLEQALAITPIALVLVDATSKILFATHNAERMLLAQNGLASRGGSLEATTSTDTSALRSAIRSSGIDYRRTLSPVRSLAIRRVSPKAPLTISVYPLRRMLKGPENDVVAVFVYDPDEKQPNLDHVLQTAFGLTPAEMRLAALIGAGINLSDSAEILGVTRNTVKTQIRSIFFKTGTSTQNRLIHLLVSLQAHLPRHDGHLFASTGSFETPR